MSSDTSGGDSEFVARRFTLTTKHETRLQKLADEHHGGNVSQCIRAAIEEHARSKEGINEELLLEIRDNIEQTEEHIERVEDALLAGTGERQPINDQAIQIGGNSHREPVPSTAPPASQPESNSISEEEIIDEVHQILLDAYPQPRGLDQICLESSATELEIRGALLELQDQECVGCETGDGEEQYSITTDDDIYNHK